MFAANVPSQTNLEPGKRAGPHYRASKFVSWAPENNFNHREKPILEDETENQEAAVQRRMRRLEKAGIKVLPAAVRYGRSDRTGMALLLWFLLSCGHVH